MPIFDKELGSNISDRGVIKARPNLESAELKQVDLSVNPILSDETKTNNLDRKGASIDEISRLSGAPSKASTFASPAGMVETSTLLENKRYPVYQRDIDLENVYGLNQSWMAQLGHGTIKMAATGLGTFVQGFASIPNAVSAIKNGKVSDFSNPNGYEASIDTWLKNIEDKFPNYYTREETKHPFLSAIPLHGGSANFWGDKVIKNVGFTVGAIGSALVQDAAIGALTGAVGEIPLLAGQIGKAALLLNKVFTGTNDVEKVLKLASEVGKTGQQILNIKKLGQIVTGSKVLEKAATGITYGLGIYGSARTEAAIEARDGYNQVKTELVKQYKFDHINEEPTGEEMSKINKLATDAMNTRFGINMVLLSVSNTVQFGSLFRTVGRGAAGLPGDLAGKIALKEGSLDVFERVIPKTVSGKVWDVVKPVLRNTFTEGVYEEGGQYAAERGTLDYYTRKYKRPDNPDRNTLNDIIASTNKGLRDQFGTDAGLENMFIGALSAVITGGVTNKIHDIRGTGEKTQLQNAVNSLNRYGMTGILSQKYGDTLNSIGIAKDMQAAANAKDVFKYKNLKDDLFFNYVSSRLPSGMHDVTVEQLNMLKDLDKEDFEKTFGMSFEESNKKTVEAYVDNLVEKANHIKETFDALDNTFKNPFRQTVSPTSPEEETANDNFDTFNDWKRDLAYYATVPENVNHRLESIQQRLITINPLLDTATLARVTDEKSQKELSKKYGEKADELEKTITNYTDKADKTRIEKQIQSLRNASERINVMINNKVNDPKTVNRLLNFELNNQDATKPDVISPLQATDLQAYGDDINRLYKSREHASKAFDALSDEKGFTKYFEQAVEIANTPVPVVNTADVVATPVPIVHEFTNVAGDKESVLVGREYELPTVRLAKVKKVAPDKWNVTDADGKVTGYPTLAEAKEAVAALNKNANSLSKVTVIALNPDGTVKVEDLADNIQNISVDRLLGYARIQTENEKLLKDKEDVDFMQLTIELASGEMATGDPTLESAVPEGKLKSADKFFISSTSQSEGSPEDLITPTTISPAAKRAVRFLNGFKNLPLKLRKNLKAILVTPNNEESLGLKGLTALSYGSNNMENATDNDLGFVAQVFVEHDPDTNKTYFVDPDGKRISEVHTQVDLSRVVFQTMPTTETIYTNGDPRYRANEKDEFIAQSKAWAVKRAELFAMPQGEFELNDFTISRGIPIEIKVNGESEKNDVGGILVDEDKIATQQGLIQLSVSGYILHDGLNHKFSSGRPVLQDEDTLQFLHNVTFGTSKAKSIYEVIKAVAAKMQADSKANRKIVFDPKQIAFLQNLLYWRKSSDTSGNQIFIDTATMSISLGGKIYAITEIANKEAEIVEQLKDTYHNVNKTPLGETRFSDPFTEYVFENGALVTKVWTNYQSYLLASKNPDGSNRTGQAPLYTSVAKATSEIPYSFKQKYSTLSELELPVQKVAPVVPPVLASIVPGTVTVDGHVMDGTTVNTFTKLNLSPIQFTSTIDEKGNISVDVKVNDTITKAADATYGSKDAVANTARIKDFIEHLKAINAYDDLDTNEQIITKLYSYTIAARLEAVRKAEPELGKPPETEEGKRVAAQMELLNEAAKDAGINQNLEDLKAGKEIIYRKPAVIELLRKDPRYNLVNNPDQSVAVVGIRDEKGEWFGVPPVKAKVGAPPKNTEERRVGKHEAGQQRMNQAEIELFKAWAAEKVPGIPIEVLENIINTYDNETAWGVFEDGVAKFFKGSIRGTEYHEVFEGIWKAFLSPEERQLLLNEFKDKSGTFVDRQSKKKINYYDATDKQAKERLADDFAEFRVGKLPARTLGERIKNFFRNLINWFKKFSNPSLKTDLFNAIEAGRFKKSVIPESIKTEAPEYSKIPGVSETQAFEYVEDITVRIAQFIFGGNIENIFDIQKITGEQIYNRVKEEYSGDEQKYQALGQVAFDQLFKRAKENLRTIGVNFNEEDRVQLNSSEATNIAYAPEPFSTDWMKTSAFAIKFVLSTNPESKPLDQSRTNTLKFPERVLSSINGFALNNFGRSFVTLMDKLSNTTKVGKAVQALVNLAKYDSNYVRIFKRLGGDLSTGTIPFHNFKDEDWRLFINFYQTFTKQKPNALIQYVSGTEVYTSSADIYSAAKLVKQGWFENMKVLAKNPASIIRVNSAELTYEVRGLNSYDFPIKTPEQMITFINAIGVDISMEEYNKFTKEQKVSFAKSVGTIRTYLTSRNSLGSIRGRTLGISEPLNILSNIYIKATNPNQENTHFNVEGTKSQSYTENNVPSVFENEFNESSTLEELMEARPELRDIFSANSVVLKKGGQFFDKDGNRIKELKISYIEGQKNLDKDKGSTTTSLNLGGRLTQEMNQNLNGNYYIIIPADGSTEWMMNLGNYVTFEEVQGKEAWDKIYATFRGYLVDDFNLALDFENRKSLRAVKGRAKELRMFKDIFYDRLLSEANTLITNRASKEEINNFINDNVEAIDYAVKLSIEATIAETKEALIKTRELTLNKDSTYSYLGLDNKFANEERANKLNKLKLTNEEIDDVLLFANANYIINMTEFHKIIFGDPYQFAIKDGQWEETKRIKSFLSPRRTTFDTPEYNTFLNQNLNKAGDIQLASTDPGSHEFKSYANTVTFADVYPGSANYFKINETDAASNIIDVAYREVKNKNSQWTAEAETWHQWQMAYTRQNMPGYVYTNQSLRNNDVDLLKTPEPIYVTEIMKPIVSGNVRGSNNIKLVLDKFSQMPLYFKAIQGTNLEKLYIKMFKENIDYVIFESGRKVGVEGTHSLYDANHNFNDAPFAENTKVQVPWKIYGIQVENSYSSPHEQTRGSQITKIASMDMFDNGVAISTEAQKQYDRNVDMLNKIHQNAYNMLLNKLGIEDLGDHFKLIDPKAISETLEWEMLRRQLDENTKDTIKLDEDGQFAIPFEASPAFKQIKDILYSMVNKGLISLKTNGGPKVQAPVVLWENAKEGRGLVIKTDHGYEKITRAQYDALPEVYKEDVRLSSDTLKFYTKDQPYCEVMLPHWFKGVFNEKRFPTDKALIDYLNLTAEGREILVGIGFRIPTQSTSSIEVFRVKGFLPQSMGDTIVVPSEITSKAGSDFDIDKLNTYLKSIYMDEKGDIKLVRYKGSEEATRTFYSDVFTNTIQKNIDKIEKYEAFRDTLLSIFTKMESLPDISITSMKDILEKEDYAFYASHVDMIYGIMAEAEDNEVTASDYMLNQIEKLGMKKDKLSTKLFSEKLRLDYVNRMYKKALENEYYDSLEKMVTLPENFDRLISPILDAGLLETSKHLDKLRGVDDSNIPNRMSNRVFMTSLRNYFSKVKQWVGIAAVNITGHSIAQKIKLYLDTNRISRLEPAVRDILGDGSILLPHNTVEVNGKLMTSLSGTKTADGKEYISGRLSGYATSIVDVAKNPFIMKIIHSDLAVGTFFFLERIGVGEKTVWFMNQPIIRDYLGMLDSMNYRFLYGKNNIKATMSRFPASDSLTANTKVDMDYLEGYIKDYSERGFFETEEENAIQRVILKEFLKYAKMAEFNFNLSQASNYDTTRFKSSDSMSRKRTKTKLASETNIFSSVEELLDKNFIGEQANFVEKIMNSLGAVIKTEQIEFASLASDVLRVYEEKAFLSNDDFEMVASKVKASLFDYIVQIKSGLNNEIYDLTVGENSVADDLLKIKDRLFDLKILNDFKVISSDRIGGAKTIKLNVNSKEPYIVNVYTDLMRELKAADPIFYERLIKLAILQGSYQSAVSFKNIIPIEDYARIIKPIIDSVTVTPDIEAFTQGVFQRNNWKSEAVMPSFVPYMVVDDAVDSGFTPFDEEIFKYTTNQLLGDTALGLSGDRRILILDPKYNSMQLSNDFLKVFRTIRTDDGLTIDFKTGITVPPSTFRMRKEAGDLSLKDVYGYQKVKYSSGEPYKDRFGRSVYRLINLYGDGQLVSEYYSDGRQSVLNNGTAKQDIELNDQEIIDFFNLTPEERAETAETKMLYDKTVPAVNIFAGLKQNTELSNFATRPFKKDGITYPTVEHAFQAAKLQYSTEFKTKEQISDVRKRMFGMSPSAVKSFGAKLAINTKEWDAHSSEIMKEFLTLSFEKNPKALDQLMNTGNAQLTHVQDNTKWKTEFPRLLMEVRRELSEPSTEEAEIIKPGELLEDYSQKTGETLGEELPSQPVYTTRIIEVDMQDITVRSDGKMFSKTGKEITDQVVKNKANVRKELQDGTLRSSIYNNFSYFVLSDDRIVGSGVTTLGKESIKDEKIRAAILAKAVTYKKKC